MTKSILNLEGVQVLSRNEQKNVNGGKLPDGGGGCAARQWRAYAPPLRGEYMVVAYDLSQADAVAFANGGTGGGHVCCTSAGCANSPWYGN
jgi:hypothetical protein